MEPGTAPELLFVYGTLRQSAAHPMHALLSPADPVGAGAMPGFLYDLGAYPGTVATDGSEPLVRGEVYALHDPAGTFAKLDTYEGCAPTDPPPHEYRRTQRVVRLDSGEEVLAWVYLYNRPVAGLAPVASGDWLRR